MRGASAPSHGESISILYFRHKAQRKFAIMRDIALTAEDGLQGGSGDHGRSSTGVLGTM